MKSKTEEGYNSVNTCGVLGSNVSDRSPQVVALTVQGSP